MSERLHDAADSAEPPPPRQASDEGSSLRPSDELLADAATAHSPAGPPPRTARADDPQARPRRATDGAVQSPAGPPPRTARADDPPPLSPRPTADGAAQSPPAGGPPQRSALSEKARAVSPGARPRRTAADVAREAAEKSARGTATSGAAAGRGDRGLRDDTAATKRRDGGPSAGERRRSDGDAAPRAGRNAAGKTGRDRTGGKDAEGAVERERPGGPWPVPERSLMATVLGVHPAGAVGVAAAFTAVGVAIDLLRTGTLGTAFTICYLAGCVLATAWVRRSGLFWPMVAPPLLMALAVPVVVLVAGTPRPGAGIAQRLLVIGAPLVNGFPMMAWTTGLVLALGVFRLVTQRVSPGRGAARGGGRTSTSPRRS